VTVLRFGLIDFAQSSADWQEKAQRSEQCGFDVLWTGDHLHHFYRPDEPMLDGWVTLAAWAAVTTRIRVGMLITNLSWRSPVLVARASAAIDQVSGGRFELGIGAGAFADQAMAGVLEMPPSERVARLAEGAAVIDRLLRGDVTPFAGRFTQYETASMAPGCVQAPRPPITIAANGDRALKVAAQYADAWNTFGGLELPVDDSSTRR
jgi:alkanesulfonate monooxygenase SsuD/methylene tetrahydromethanopterin reductase-like flavin-dependent oxidoreductase (luciferase family)